jgi:hypothetical protein
MIATITAASRPEASIHLGARLRVDLPDGQVLHGSVLRTDVRTVRLRPDGRPGLVVIYRAAARIAAV